MTFQNLAQFLEKLEATSSRNLITKILADLLNKANNQEIDKICYLLAGRLVPSYLGIDFNLAEKMMVQVLARAYGKSPAKAQSLYKSKGDLGDVAYQISNLKSRNSKLSIVEVYEKLMEIAQESGKGSQERKMNKMAKLLSGLDPLSAKFVARIPVGKLRLGFSEATVLEALSVMEKGDKNTRVQIEQAYNVTADIGKIAQLVKKSGVKSLSKILPQPGIPIRPALAERLPTAQKIIEKVGPKVALEPKLDGFRMAIHIWREGGRKKVALFSRNLENTTHMFPEIVAAAQKLQVKSAIFDSEAIGYNPKTGKFASFQQTVQRKREYGIEEFAKKLPLKAFVFDILYLNGKSLFELPLAKRREILKKTLSKNQGGIKLADQKITSDSLLVEQELKKNIEAGLEGLVVKKLDAPYQAGSRGFHWVKFKSTSAALEKLRGGRKAKVVGLLDTIDCVVMGAYKGRGKRATFGVGGFLLGILGKDGKFYTISKLGSGLSDERFREANRRVGKLKVSNQPKEYVVLKEEIPDIWVRPSLVVEILADEITLSSGKGYSLRFPRLVRFRDDKNPPDATSLKEIEEMYRLQLKRKR